MPREAIEASFWPDEQKKELALKYLSEGEMALLQGSLGALSCFEVAANLDGQNPQVWYRQGLAFFEYGSQEGKEKALLVASKNFKAATQIDPQFFDAWVAWGNVLLQLGKFHEEHHFFTEAKEKYEKAIELSKEKPKAVLAELYWDYGLAWAGIAEHSGEALDVRLAIEAFKTSRSYQENPSPEFLNDCGKAYLEMGLLINDSRLYVQSVDSLEQAVKLAPQYVEGWSSLGEAYSQLYINTLDERYVNKASDAYSMATRLSPDNAEIWLGWGQILGESGKHNKDAKLLKLSAEKCAKAAQLDNEDPLIVSQWAESLAWLGQITSRFDLIVEAEHKLILATEQFPDDPDLWLAYGVCLMAFGKYYEDGDYYEMAIEKLQYGLSVDRSDPELWHTLGLVHKHYAELTNNEDLIERANRFLAKAMDLKPGCPALLFDAACSLFLFSDILDDLPSLEQSIVLFELLLRNHKETLLYHPEWLYQYACALASLGDFTEEGTYYTQAIEIFTHVLLIDPDFPRIHHKAALSFMELGHLTGESDYYRRAVHFFRLATRQDEENDQVWLDWGICLIHLAHHTLDSDFMHQLYMDAEIKLTKAGRLGNEGAHYSLACLYSILGRLQESMSLVQKALTAHTLPSIEALHEDEWLDNLRSTSAFAQFLAALEAKMQQTREE